MSRHACHGAPQNANFRNTAAWLLECRKIAA
jgi:hypothetical protein